MKLPLFFAIFSRPKIRNNIKDQPPQATEQHQKFCATPKALFKPTIRRQLPLSKMVSSSKTTTPSVEMTEKPSVRYEVKDTSPTTDPIECPKSSKEEVVGNYICECSLCICGAPVECPGDVCSICVKQH
ncbi:hypothetical protein B0J18DRAFT_433971 [Chaetomium sp. MPI-SDFR-AT-0129]|nr:hypothetical protein B0J18DRAFT_433971 [Chaetomium sp. MPI-SDFR-AT-0129]